MSSTRKKESPAQEHQRAMREFNEAINYAIDTAGIDAGLFLSLWREGAWDEIARDFPDFQLPLQAQRLTI